MRIILNGVETEFEYKFYNQLREARVWRNQLIGHGTYFLDDMDWPLRGSSNEHTHYVLGAELAHKLAREMDA